MGFEARDIEVNKYGRFTFLGGVDNVVQKVECLFIPLLRQFIGQKSAVPLGSVLGSIQVMRIIRNLYLRAQDTAVNREFYDADDIVEDIDEFEVKQVYPTEIQFRMRVVMPDKSLVIGGTIPVNDARRL